MISLSVYVIKGQFEESQYIRLSNRINSNNEGNLNTQFIIKLIKNYIRNKISHILKCLIYQKGMERILIILLLHILLKVLNRFSQQNQENLQVQ
ncbi:unnamed protein product [Paramecium octaurelia]|uniref:Uncharacterized protein n=1 Tax=Paramecium octaurelia TaxID=43137 RepID=A0A8S1UD95_PAROT|nr:unnamed protein product [Paramecium octaurelia]